MDKKIEFNEALSAIIELAKVQANTLEFTQIEMYFKDIIKDNEAYDHIYKYLCEHKITVKGYIKKSPIKDEALSDTTSIDTNYALNSEDNISNKETFTINDLIASIKEETERNIFKMYLEELKNNPTYNKEELFLNCQTSYEKNNNITIPSISTDNLTTAFLPLVIDLSISYSKSGISANDLIQEGNLGLVEGIFTYDYSATNSSFSSFESYIKDSINNALKDALNEHNSQALVASRISTLANQISNATVELSQDLGREPSLEELSKHLSLSEEEIKNVMKMSLDALNAKDADLYEETFDATSIADINDPSSFNDTDSSQ